jgi:uncharacterized protein
MINTVEIKVVPERKDDIAFHLELIKSKTNNQKLKIEDIHLKRRNVDARAKQVYYVLIYEIGTKTNLEKHKANYKQTEDNQRVIIIGAGPAGYFAALELIEHGIKPIILERGKDVQARRKDLRNIQQFGIVNPHSNYCFGEGGAGTYSDGKLYTRSIKRGNVKKVLEILVEHGAKEDILIDAHPHIGSNKLPNIVKAIRESIETFGGEVHFDHFVTDFIIRDNRISGVIVNDKEEFIADSVILATGHSARDIFELFRKRKLSLEFKEYALGVRVEHPQELIDEIQYKQKQRDNNLPASKYGLVCQVEERGVFSFCMCPGGFIVPASTAAGELVINGMSLSRRDSYFANSGVVVSIKWDDLKDYHEHGEFAGLEFQKEVERSVFESVNSDQQIAPAQRLTDFTKSKGSSSLLKTSYIPGIDSQPLHEILPSFIANRLQKAFQEFDKKMRGYLTNEAQILATESRTSSPIRIPRDLESLIHPEIDGLYPCGEGAGYAGGIISAAIDGQRVANAIIERKFKKH